MTVYESVNTLVEFWGDTGKLVSECAVRERNAMSFDEFLNHCTCCGGNWGGMFLTGIQELFPKTYDAIPDDMGCNAFTALCNVLFLCGVEWNATSETD